jgi:flagellar biosynthesis protein FlhG
MAFPSDFRQAQPADQADGLRRLFSVRSVRFIPVVSNPFVQHQDQLLHRMMVALESLGLYTLMVDASERAPRARDGGLDGLAKFIEPRSDRRAYLAARGLPERWSESVAGPRGFLRAIIDAAPLSQAVLLHASAAELARLFGSGEQGLSRPRPLVLCDERADAVTHAYASLKRLATEVGWREHDMLMSAEIDAPAPLFIGVAVGSTVERRRALGGRRRRRDPLLELVLRRLVP